MFIHISVILLMIMLFAVLIYP